MESERILGILRHGEAISSSYSSDLLRPLTERGFQDIIRVSQRLNELQIQFEAILTSPALRAYHSALIVFDQQEDKPMHFQVEFPLYNTSLQEYLQLIWNLSDSFFRVLIVGHNPTISELANYVCSEISFSMEAGQMCLFKVPFPSWKMVSQDSLLLFENLYPFLR